jgi:hypothetical protein
MPGIAGKIALLCPPAIAIHHDRDMAGEFPLVDFHQ